MNSYFETYLYILTNLIVFLNVFFITLIKIKIYIFLNKIIIILLIKAKI